MKNKIAKIITILLSVSFLMCTLNTTVLAAKGKITTPSELDKQVTYGDSTEFVKIAGKVMGFIRNSRLQKVFSAFSCRYISCNGSNTNYDNGN